MSRALVRRMGRSGRSFPLVLEAFQPSLDGIQAQWFHSTPALDFSCLGNQLPLLKRLCWRAPRETEACLLDPWSCLSCTPSVPALQARPFLATPSLSPPWPLAAPGSPSPEPPGRPSGKPNSSLPSLFSRHLILLPSQFLETHGDHHALCP